MTTYKTAAPCEVCGQRVSHHGIHGGFVVGFRTTGIKRLVHQSCGREWDQRKSQIMAKWPELRPAVLTTLPTWLQIKITSCLGQHGGVMPRGPSRDRFPFPPEVTEYIRQTITSMVKDGERRKGLIKKVYEVLQRDHPEWVPAADVKTGYTDFYDVWRQQEQQLAWERDRAVPAATPPQAPPPEAPVVSSVPSADEELVALAKTAHALIDLAVARRNRDALELALIELEIVIKRPAPPAAS